MALAKNAIRDHNFFRRRQAYARTHRSTRNTGLYVICWEDGHTRSDGFQGFTCIIEARNNRTL